MNINELNTYVFLKIFLPLRVHAMTKKTQENKQEDRSIFEYA